MECFRCGVCCTRYQAPLNSAEARHIADYLGLPLNVFLNRFTDHRWHGQDSLLSQFDGACVFLEGNPNSKQNNCRIQPVKPSACCEWEPGLHPPECLAGLSRYWQLSVNDAGQLAGNQEKLDEFQSFLRSLAVSTLSHER